MERGRRHDAFDRGRGDDDRERRLPDEPGRAVAGCACSPPEPDEAKRRQNGVVERDGAIEVGHADGQMVEEGPAWYQSGVVGHAMSLCVRAEGATHRGGRYGRRSDLSKPATRTLTLREAEPMISG